MDNAQSWSNPIDVADSVTLLRSYQGLLKSVAKRYQGKVTFEEAYQEACTAFLSAITTYDPAKGPFSAYVAAKVPGDVRTAMRRIWTWQDRVAFVAGGQEDDDDAEALDRVQTLAAPAEALEPECLKTLMLQDVIEAGRLSDREHIWLDGFLAGLSREEIALKHHVSGETVKTWRKRVLQKLRQAAAALGYTADDISM